MRNPARWLPLIGLLVAACSSLPTDPEAPATAPPPLSLKTTSEADLTFLNHAAGAPSLATLSTSFWAVKGQTRQASLYYHARPGNDDSTEFVRFRVNPKTLRTRPNGTAFATGDSILITITVVDTVKLIVDYQPTGLHFEPKDPARLWMSWTETDRDLNNDGAVNGTDDTIRLATQAVWAQEFVGGPWAQLKTSFDFGFEQMSVKPTSFTRYAVAY